MSQYELLRAELSQLRMRQVIALVCPTIGTAVLVVNAMRDTHVTTTSFFLGVASIFVTPLSVPPHMEIHF